MNRSIILIPVLLLIMGCHTPTHNTPPTNQTERLQMIGALSAGIETNIIKNNIPAASILNHKIANIADVPTPSQVNIATNNQTETDSIITKLIEKKRHIEKDNIDQLAKLRESNKESEAKLKELSNPFSAIKYGVTTIIKRLAWTLAGIGILFLLLKVFATSNPIVGAIFNIIERFVAYIITAICSIFPKAVEYGSSVFKNNTETLSVLCDAIETLPDTATISELKIQLSKDTDTTHRKVITEIKTKLGW